MSAVRSRPRIPAWAPPLSCALVVALLAAMLRLPVSERGVRILPAAALFDFTFTVPLLWWLLAVRGRGASPGSLIGVFAASMVAARILVGHRTPFTTAWLVVAGAAVEGLLITRVALAVRAGRRAVGADLAEKIQAAVMNLFGQSPLGRVVGDEMALLGYALLGPWRRPVEGEGRFSHQKELGRGSLVSGLLVVILIEAGAVHVALAHAHPRIAWILAALSLWGAFWLFGDYQALRLRRSTLTPGKLELRVGLRARATVPLAAVAKVQSGGLGDLPKEKTLLRAYPNPADPTVLLELDEPVTVRGLYARPRRCTRIALAPDERERFVAELEAALRSRTRP